MTVGIGMHVSQLYLEARVVMTCIVNVQFKGWHRVSGLLSENYCSSTNCLPALL